jgi:translation initiation factor 2 subunit 1
VQVQEALLKNIKRRMTPQPLKIRADVELTCFAYDGVERIRDAMRAAQVKPGGPLGGGVSDDLAQQATAARGLRMGDAGSH